MILSFTVKIGLLIFLGLTTATIGLMTYVFFPGLLESIIDRKLAVEEGSESYGFWKDNPVPIYIKFYFFNITNPMDVWDNISKPILEEVGPYTFREARHKVNITWNSNDTVSYRQVKRWYFQSDLTDGSLDDIITTLNVPMVAAASKAKHMNSDFVYFALNGMFEMTDSVWFIRKPVRQLLFEGYNDTLVKLAQELFDLPYDKFGWFYKRNNTDDGEFTMFTGEKDILHNGEINKWNGMSTVKDWKPPCNMINGSAGDFFPPYSKPEGRLSMFVTDICRSLHFSYISSKEIRGLKAYRYWADNTELDNGKIDHDNKCFCKYECLPPGALNVSSCKFDAPALVSYPHFLFADPSYSEGVIGLHPDPKKHEMYIDIEPRMGIPLGVAARMQINIVVERVEKLLRFSNITERKFYPVLWFSETADVDDSIAQQLRLVLYHLPVIADALSFFLVAVGSVFVLTALILAILFHIGKIKSDPQIYVPMPSEENLKVNEQTEGN